MVFDFAPQKELTALNLVLRRKWFPFVSLPILLLAQTVYYTWVYESSPSNIPTVDMVLIYSGWEDRTEIVRDWGNVHAPVFIVSGQDYRTTKLERDLKSARTVIVEEKARTTDQNARYSAPLIKKSGVHSAVLALPWYQLPRALFLTRFYLLGSGVAVTPYATVPTPKNWWRDPLFYREFLKFWGSLGRIILSWVGIENWPRPEIISS